MNDILFSEVCGKVKELMSAHVFRHRTGKQYSKYIVLSVSEVDKTVTVMDRENKYDPYRLPYVATMTKEGLVVNIDYEKKVDMALGVTEKAESLFNVADEVEMIAKDVSAFDVSTYSNSKITELNSKLNETTGLYETAQAKVTELETHLAVFEKEKKQFMEQKHKDIVDTLIASRREEMGKFSEYLDYCIKSTIPKALNRWKRILRKSTITSCAKIVKRAAKRSFPPLKRM